MTGPVLEYSHDAGCSSITGGAFVPGSAFGAARAGSYYYADYVCGTIFERRPDGTVLPFATDLGRSSAVALVFGPADGGQALYYLSYAGGGAVHRIVATTGNTVPVAVPRATGTDPATTTVQLDGSGSYDPDGGDEVASYRWQFGDGTSARTASPTISHRYPDGAARTVTLTVVDRHGGRSAPARCACSRATRRPS